MPPYSSNLRDLIGRGYTPTQGASPTATTAMLPTFVPTPFTTGSYLDGCVQRAVGGHSSGIPPGCIVQLCGASGCGKTTVALAAAVHVLADAILLLTNSPSPAPYHHVIWVSSTLTTQPFPTSLLIAAVHERLEELGHPDAESIDASHLEPLMTVVVGVQTPGHLLGVLQHLNDQASSSTSTSSLGKAGRILVVLDCGAVVLQAASSELIPQRAVGDGDELILSGAAPLRKTSYPFVLSELKRSIRNLTNTLLHRGGNVDGGGAAVIMTNMCTSSGGRMGGPSTSVPFGGPVWRSIPDVSILMTMTDEEPFLDTVNIEQTFTIVS